MSLQGEVLAAVQRARARVYQVGAVTPLQQLDLEGVAASVWVKREDLGPIKAYKWRGAFNAMAAMSQVERDAGFVAASAGNHAQGVALAAKKLGAKARIFMPEPTPLVKQRAVRAFGGDAVEIVLTGDRFSDTQEEAKAWAVANQDTFVPPYDAINVMGGQGTLADEVVMAAEAPFDRVYVAIGGGGLAASTAAVVKFFWPETKVIGVEGEQQASMKAAIEAGHPVKLDYIDLFCDGTAVTQVGKLTFALCRDLLDDIVTVSNAQVSEAIEAHWDALRVVPEPSGAMSLAGFVKDQRAGKVASNERVLTVLCGANMDFAQVAEISRQAALSGKNEQTWEFSIPESNGSLVELLRNLPEDVSIVDLQYGRVAGAQQVPRLTLTLPEGKEAAFETWAEGRTGRLVGKGDDSRARFRVVPFSPALFVAPWFIEVEFPERAGALLRFMQEVRPWASLCYFNYTYTGERVGRALMGLDFASAEEREKAKGEIEGLAPGVVRAIFEQEVLPGE